MQKYAKLIVVASWSVVRYDYSIEKFFELYMDEFGVFCPNYFLFDTLQYRDISQSGYLSDNIVEMGNAKFDGIYYATRRSAITEGRWEKLKGKTTVLWTTSHGIENGVGVVRTCTFDLYAKAFFDYANNHPEMGFIFRPSISLFSEMLKFGFWSQSVYCRCYINICF